MPLVSVASDISGPNYRLVLPSELQFGVYTTIISLNPSGFLIVCDDHVLLTDGKTGQERQG